MLELIWVVIKTIFIIGAVGLAMIKIGEHLLGGDGGDNQ